MYLAAGDVPLAVLHVLQVRHALAANHLQRKQPKFSPDLVHQIRVSERNALLQHLAV
jgi:hypothetical protein